MQKWVCTDRLLRPQTCEHWEPIYEGFFGKVQWQMSAAAKSLPAQHYSTNQPVKRHPRLTVTSEHTSEYSPLQVWTAADFGSPGLASVL